MYCSLLKFVKLIYISTAMFHSSTSVYMHKQRPVALRHEIHYPAMNVHSTSLVMQDKRWYGCFRHKNSSFTFLTPQLGFEYTSSSNRPKPSAPIPSVSVKRTMSQRPPPPLHEDSSSESDSDSGM